MEPLDIDTDLWQKLVDEAASREPIAETPASSSSSSAAKDTVAVPLDICSALFFPNMRLPGVRAEIDVPVADFRALRSALFHARDSNYTGIVQAQLGQFHHKTRWIEGALLSETIMPVQWRPPEKWRENLVYYVSWSNGKKNRFEALRTIMFEWKEGKLVPPHPLPPI